MYEDLFSPERIRETAFFTGHRRLSHTETKIITAHLDQSITSAYSDGYRRFMCGCALGFDTLAALQILRLKQLYPDMILSLAIPCLTQAERWTEADQKVYRNILEQADDKTVLSPDYYKGVMLARNRFMADRSSLCICYLRHMHGGTASTVRYALIHNHIRIINLAVLPDNRAELLREETWNCIYTSHSAERNAVTVPLHLLQTRKLFLKHI